MTAGQPGTGAGALICDKAQGGDRQAEESVPDDLVNELLLLVIIKLFGINSLSPTPLREIHVRYEMLLRV